jgi:CheY-like chemotaxis protein
MSQVVLVADDDEDILLLVRDVLESLGCEVQTAMDGAQALEVAGDATLALAVLDVRMPRIDGLTVALQLRSDPATRSVPILILSASVGEHQERAARAVGADAFLSKPFDLDELRRTVQSLLGRASSAQPA